jgi:hypothetical protein
MYSSYPLYSLYTHYTHLGSHLNAYKGTSDYLPMAKWLGSLRSNSEYRQHLEGAPPGVAEAVGIKMVQPPMHFTDASKRATSPISMETVGSGLSSGGSTYDEVARSILSDSEDLGSCGDGTSSVNGIIRSRRSSSTVNARFARRRRARQAIVECGGKIGVDHHEPSLYPIPGKAISKYHRVNGKDKARALARPYVGMNMNHMRRHISTGNGDGRAASNWIGSLRSNAKGADGGYIEYMKRVEEICDNKEGDKNENAMFDSKKADDEEVGNEKVEGERKETTDQISGERKKLKGATTALTKSKRRKGKKEKGETKYVGNKTQAQMDGVPLSMRWQKPNNTKGYLRMKQQLNRGTVKEVAKNFSLRGHFYSSNNATGWMRTSNTSSTSVVNTKEQEKEKRLRRMAYGNASAIRFKLKKKQGGWVE